MASVKRHPSSKFWYGCFTAGPGGKQFQRSTRQTNKKAALEIAHLWERPFQQRLQHDQARRVFAESFQAASGETLSHSSTRDFLTAWLARKNIETKPNTWKKYQAVVNQFLSFLADRSCNHRSGHIRLNTELVKKPKELLDYVVLHEVAHLLAPTHSERFIGILNANYASWLEARAELNELPLASHE